MSKHIVLCQFTAMADLLFSGIFFKYPPLIIIIYCKINHSANSILYFNQKI